MPLMTQIRNNLSKAFAIFAVFFIVYIVLDWGMDIGDRQRGGGGDVIGAVDGTEISYREFSELLRAQSEAYRQQTGNDPDDQTEQQIRSQVWNSVTQQALIELELERLGITVTDDEIRDILLGSNPPEAIANQFKDSLGVFNRAAYDRAVADPQNSQAWIQVERDLRRQRRIEKLQSILFASMRITDGELRQRFIDQNVTMEADYVLFDPNRLVPDSMIVVADSDIERHYNTTQNEFKVRAARKLKYVLFNLAPTGEDSAIVLAEMDRLTDQLNNGMDFMELARSYSEIPPEEKWVKHGELTRQRETAAFSARKGAVVGPVADVDGYHLIRVLDERKGEGEFVRASHILLNAVSGPDSVAQIEKARSLLQQVRGGADFAALALEHSQDVSNKAQGGELGWTGRGGWVAPFERAAFGARVGDVVGPVRTQFGWHLIKVTGRDSRELKVVQLSMKVKASPRSIDLAYARADDFAVLAEDEGFEKSAELSAYEVRETPEFTKGGFIPGLGVSDAVMNFAFTGKLNAISTPMTVAGGVAVFKVSAIREEGVRPLEDVKGIVRSQVVRKKKMDQLRERVNTFYATLTPSTDLLPAAQSLQNVNAQKSGPFKAGEAPLGVGRDYAFIGTALALNPGDLSKPFEGARGYYIVKLNSKTPFDSLKFSNDRNTLRDQLLQEKQNRLFSEWLTALRDKAEIEDYRDRFFR
ncbi:MAG: peptidylprolyl isomerase [Bacteroidota bacterium]